MRFPGRDRFVVSGQRGRGHLLLGDRHAASARRDLRLGGVDPRPALAGDLQLLRERHAPVQDSDVLRRRDGGAARASR